MFMKRHALYLSFLTAMMSQPLHANNMDYVSLMDLFEEPVTTSATGKPQRTSNAPASMVILTQEDIRRSGAVDIPEVLRTVNGVNVVQTGEHLYNVSIRGYNQPANGGILTLINGRQVYLDHFGYTEWSTLPVQLDEIVQIEVVKGPNTSLFGFNAAAGVINIITQNPVYNDESSFSATVGSRNLGKVSLVQNFKPTEDLGFRLSLGARESDRFNNQQSLSSVTGKPIWQRPEQEQLNFDSFYNIDHKQHLRFEFGLTNSNQSGNSPIGAGTGHFRTRGGRLSYQYDAGQYGLIKASLTHNNLIKSVESDTFNASINNSITIAQLENTIPISNNHTIRLSGEHRFNKQKRQDPNGSYAADGTEVHYKVYSLGAMWDWQISPTVSWTNSGRWDNLQLGHNGRFTDFNFVNNSDTYDHELSEWSYTSGIVWHQSAQNTFRANTARGLELPSLTDYMTDTAVPNPLAPGTFIAAIGNPLMDPAAYTNYELAWTRKFTETPYLDGMDASVFYLSIDNLKSGNSSQRLGFPTPGPTLAVIADNPGRSQSYGFELGFDGHINEKLEWKLGYIFQNFDDDLLGNITGNNLNYNAEYENSNPKHHANLNLRYTSGPWELDGLGYYVSSSDQPALNNFGQGTMTHVPSYIGANARIGYHFDNGFNIALSGNQIQTNDLKTNAIGITERRVFLTISKRY